MDAPEYRGDEEDASALRVQLRLGPRSLDVRAGILSLEPVVLPADAGARTGVSQKSAGQLVSKVRDGAGERAGRRGMLLAARRHTRRAARAGAVVPEDHRVC